MTPPADVPYAGLPVPAMHPHRLAWTSFVHGGPRPDPQRIRILEFGCGDGAHLLAALAHEPGWTGLGVDLEPRAIEAARAWPIPGRAAFEVADVASVGIEPGAWNVVVAHGIYSWIDPVRRGALLAQIRRALAPDGLAGVSFNALPGWAVRGRVRELLVRHPGRLDLVEAHALEGAWGTLLRHELRRAREARPDYAAHEYLAAHNEAFLLGDFVRDAAREGLRWIGDSLFDLPEGRGFEHLKASMGVAGVEGEELADLAGFRQFRCAVLCRDDAPHGKPADLPGEVLVSGVVGAVREPFRLEAGVEERMRSAGGLELQVAEALGKAALIELAAIYPDALGIGDLEDRATTLLARFGIASPAGERRALEEGVVRLWRAGALDLRLHRPSVARPVPARPRAGAFARFEASRRPVLSTPLGTSIPLADADRRLVAEGGPLPEAPAALLARWGLLEDA